ncbi:MAG TPA: hypothetical protein VES42_28410 [Pilimelia sp.]|nr:hypothetical protein [Pilimelia sp.]
MRRLRVAAVPLAALALFVALAGCAGQDGDAPGIATAGKGGSASATPSAGPSDDLPDEERRLKFAECMRGEGLDVPDPGTGDGPMFRFREGQDRAKVEKAMEACRQYAPNGGRPPRLDGAQLEQFRKLAKCMRENGIENFPDPAADGGIRLNRNSGIDPESAEFKAATEKCRQFRPSPGPRRDA